MSLKNLNDIIEKYEAMRKNVNSIKLRRMYGLYATEDKLLLIDEFIKDLKSIKEVTK